MYGAQTIAQNISQINNKINLSDSLVEKELRIYKIEGITDYINVLRIYKDSSETWRAELYESYSTDEKRNNKVKLNLKNNDSLWAAILTTEIQNLDNLSDIDYKLRSERRVVLYDGEYQNFSKKISIIDGKSYVVIINSEDSKNEIIYSNPESYYKHYPEVDELIFFNNFLQILKDKFPVW